MADTCVLWTKAKNRHGYGVLRRGGRNYLAHRWALAQHLGRDPIGVVRHTCDTPACINVEHLVEGSQADNLDDAMIKGRLLKKLSKEQAEEIVHAHEAGETQRALAARFGLVQSSVWGVINRRSHGR